MSQEFLFTGGTIYLIATAMVLSFMFDLDDWVLSLLLALLWPIVPVVFVGMFLYALAKIYVRFFRRVLTMMMGRRR
jgi:hypothetical protein